MYNCIINIEKLIFLICKNNVKLEDKLEQEILFIMVSENINF